MKQTTKYFLWDAVLASFLALFLLLLDAPYWGVFGIVTIIMLLVDLTERR